MICKFASGALLHDDPADCVEALKQDAARWRAVRDHFVGCEMTEGRYDGFALFGIPHGVGGFGSPLSEDSNIDHYADQLVARAASE